ncbi:hypothetical protein BGX38DRAFT_1265305 [Terfezia claveryi]|nr:hypothetical protein BGX38DRAFT_1265305 [Terfezia claveryi]
MFLIENDEKSILYTGDIRAEPWWVEAIARHPVLLPYTMGIKRLSTLYLDTSCASRENLYQDFTTKVKGFFVYYFRQYNLTKAQAEGIKELIEKIMKYPKDVTFHFNTWTFGYEDVWIHVDRYQHRLFRSIKAKSASAQGPYLNGFAFGNSAIEGRLTNNPECRFHSCDRKLECPGLQGKKVVYIVPIITRVGNVEVQEVGVGQGDLESHSELPLHSDNLKMLVNILGSTMSPQVKELLLHAVHSRSEALSLGWGTDEKIAFSILSKVLAKVAETKELSMKKLIVDGAEVKKEWDAKVEECVLGENGEWLPTRVSFPYSRHSSYKELRHLVGKFRPLDVYPCVVDEYNWSESTSIRTLFGDHCSGDQFAHDEEMCLLRAQMWGDTEREPVADHNIRIFEHRSSKLVLGGKDSDFGSLNEQKWLEQLRMLQPPMATAPANIRGVSPMKGALKREASDGDIQDGGLTIREKRSRVGLEIITRCIKGTEQGTECGERKIKIEPLSDREERGVIIKNEPQIERAKDETDDDLTADEEGENEAREGELRDTIDETLLVDLRGNHARKEIPQKRIGASSLPPEDRPCRKSNEGRSSKGWGNENQKPHTPRSQSTGFKVGSEGTESNHLTEEQKCSVTSARQTSTYQVEAPPLYATNQNQSSISNTRTTKGIYGIHITGHLPLPLPPDMGENFDLQELKEATMSALQIRGRSWWDIDLQSTRRKWKYEKEVEL